MVIDPVKVNREDPGPKTHEAGEPGYSVHGRQVLVSVGEDAWRLRFGRCINSLAEAVPSDSPQYEAGRHDGQPAHD